MKKKKTVKIEVKNNGFGCRCDQCGHHFEDGVCSNGHIEGEKFTLLIKRT